MELSVTFQHGPLDAEFTGKDREEIQENLVAFVDFLEENAEEFAGIEPPEPDSEELESPSLDRWQNGTDEPVTEDTISSASDEDNPLSPLARKANTTKQVLDEIVYVDPEGEEEPQMMVDKSELGSNKTARQRTAAYVLLRVWEDCYGEERMKTSELKSILTMSGVSDNDLFNAWKGPGQGDFDPTGSGVSATVGLTGPGKRRALKKIQQLAEEHS